VKADDLRAEALDHFAGACIKWGAARSGNWLVRINAKLCIVVFQPRFPLQLPLAINLRRLMAEKI
jgi:hypothetical protein